jgi:hypothetical protein
MEKIIASFINDENKMKDFKILSKKEFLESYSYINSESYDLTLKIIKEGKCIDCGEVIDNTKNCISCKNIRCKSCCNNR